MVTKPREMRTGTIRLWIITLVCSLSCYKLHLICTNHESLSSSAIERISMNRNKNIEIKLIVECVSCEKGIESIWKWSIQTKRKWNEDDPVSNRSIQLSNALTPFFDFHCHNEHQIGLRWAILPHLNEKSIVIMRLYHQAQNDKDNICHICVIEWKCIYATMIKPNRWFGAGAKLFRQRIKTGFDVI